MFLSAGALTATLLVAGELHARGAVRRQHVRVFALQLSSAVFDAGETPHRTRVHFDAHGDAGELSGVVDDVPVGPREQAPHLIGGEVHVPRSARTRAIMHNSCRPGPHQRDVLQRVKLVRDALDPGFSANLDGQAEFDLERDGRDEDFAADLTDSDACAALCDETHAGGALFDLALQQRAQRDVRHFELGVIVLQVDIHRIQRIDHRVGIHRDRKRRSGPLLRGWQHQVDPCERRRRVLHQRQQVHAMRLRLRGRIYDQARSETRVHDRADLEPSAGHCERKGCVSEGVDLYLNRDWILAAHCGANLHQRACLDAAAADEIARNHVSGDHSVVSANRRGSYNQAHRLSVADGGLESQLRLKWPGLRDDGSGRASWFIIEPNNRRLCAGMFGS